MVLRARVLTWISFEETDATALEGRASENALDGIANTTMHIMERIIATLVLVLLIVHRFTDLATQQSDRSYWYGQLLELRLMAGQLGNGNGQWQWQQRNAK